MKNAPATFVFQLVLWTNDGNELIESKMIKVKRVLQDSAKNFMAKKYPAPYFFELYKIN